MKEGLNSKTHRTIGKQSEPNSTGSRNKEKTKKETERD
jgi:hypothetical protein